MVECCNGSNSTLLRDVFVESSESVDHGYNEVNRKRMTKASFVENSGTNNGLLETVLTLYPPGEGLLMFAGLKVMMRKRRKPRRKMRVLSMQLEQMYHFDYKRMK